MKKKNLIKKIILLITVIISTNIFALAVIDNNTNQDGAIDFKSSSSNYQFDAEVGAAAVGRSTSSNYILDHGAYWDQYYPPNPTTETYGGGGGGIQTNYPGSGSQITYGSSSDIIPTKVITKSVENDCESSISCSSIAIIKEINFISQYIINQSIPIVEGKNTREISKEVIYLLISLLLILIIIILYITYKRMKNHLNKSNVENKNKHD